ncbi:hypothetical protein GCM10009836_20310 [Pseudonocardia ailaonensis]|uniref:SprT-like family protein n=1 Tax=Pseudonocardia ailaonensis TaxID=367279 RepID=A0ABN2MX35_9PSEU
MIRALERAWSAIRARHPEIPAVVIVVGAGSGTGPELKLGHFAAMRWGADPDETAADGLKPDRLPEVFVGGEGLARGPADVLATLLHEAAHALAHVRGIKDTSRQGRWHNAKFKALAEELGIAVTKDPKIGWSPTTLHNEMRRSYAAPSLSSNRRCAWPGRLRHHGAGPGAQSPLDRGEPLRSPDARCEGRIRRRADPLWALRAPVRGGQDESGDRQG